MMAQIPIYSNLAEAEFMLGPLRVKVNVIAVPKLLITVEGPFGTRSILIDDPLLAALVLRWLSLREREVLEEIKSEVRRIMSETWKELKKFLSF